MSALHFLFLRLPFVFICMLPGSAAHADLASANDAWITRYAVKTETGQSIPVGAFGLMILERPRIVTLLSLRGMGGGGKVILRSHEPDTCLMFPIRFVAGDFGGDTISGHLADPIYLVIKSRRVAKALARGHDVVSDSYRVSGRTHPDADIVLQSGLDESFGFVINPGRNILSDLIGLSTQNIACHTE